MSRPASWARWTLSNLTGHVEHHAHLGTLITDFSLVRPGALHRANGGYLVLDARKLLAQPFAWDALKRAMRAREIRIDPLERLLGVMSTSSLEPEPLPLDVCARRPTSPRAPAGPR